MNTFNCATNSNDGHRLDLTQYYLANASNPQHNPIYNIVVKSVRSLPHNVINIKKSKSYVVFIRSAANISDDCDEEPEVLFDFLQFINLLRFALREE
ncbi:hypothetical protein X798_00750 [Onchocerca flexuosa]|uniref:Uncharacterized protein n=1 Tax=Onchocerca flexuosa TaxID=387005 RepID=A0A238C455_9BILA|nr:hypothetical protein X798_00750 [Onchocerca flexuosa]